MARSSEIVRQWEILREIDAARTGIPIAKLAALRCYAHAVVQLRAFGQAAFFVPSCGRPIPSES